MSHITTLNICNNQYLLKEKGMRHSLNKPSQVYPLQKKKKPCLVITLVELEDNFVALLD